MTEDRQEGFVGISLTHDHLRMTEGARSSGEFLITNLAQGRLRQPFDFQVFSEKNYIPRFAEDINRLYQASHFEGRHAAFSLDSRMVLVKKLPIDPDLAGEELHEHVLWEARQFLLSPLAEYNIAYERLEPTEVEPEPHVLVVAVRKSIISYLRQVFEHTDLHLDVVDVDIFAAQRALERNYESLSDEHVALVDVGEQALHVVLLRNGEYFLSQEVPFPADETKTLLQSDAERLAKLIARELRRILLDNKLAKAIEELDGIFLYGEGVDDEVVEALRNSHDVRIERVNPFKKVRLKADRTADRHLRPETFTVAVGAALRGESQNNSGGSHA
jgi:type IV pilus assembly protein PilM